ncbi:hypothetical protein CPC16_011797, partial [Podila verticillata]
MAVLPITSAQTIPEDIANSPDPSTSAAPPKELFPGILDPGPHPNNTLRFGVLMPLNLTKPEDASWKTLVMHTVTAIRLAVEDINAEKMLPASDALSSKILYNYFIRTVPTTEALAQQYLDYMRLMGWHRLGILYSDDSFGRSLNNDLMRFSQAYGVTIVISEAIYIPHSEKDNIDTSLSNIRQTGSYINIIAGSDAGVMRAIHDLHLAGMFQLPYVWLTMNNLEESIQEVYGDPGTPYVTDFDGLVMLGMLEVLKNNPQYVEFQKRWANLDPDLYPGAGVNEDLIHAETRAYSCVRMIALGYQKDIEVARARGVSEQYIMQELVQGSYPRTIGNLSSDLFSTIEYDGPAGRIEMDRYGNTVSVAAVFYQLQQGKSVVVAKTLP